MSNKIENSGTGRLAGKRILFIANRSLNFWVFRREIIEKIAEEGGQVFLAANSDAWTEKIRSLPAEFIEIKSDLNTSNPIIELANVANIYRAIRRSKPDLVHTFTIKPNLYGPGLARLSRVKSVICMVTGFGTVMIGGSMRKRVLRTVVKAIYTRSFKAADRIVVTNSDDFSLCVSEGIAGPDKLLTIPGAGVDIDRFAPSDAFDISAARERLGVDPDKVNLFFVGRMTREKGLEDLCRALGLSDLQDIRLHLVGETDRKNPTALDPDAFCRSDSRIVHHGTTDRIADVYRLADIVVLPSYREGMPTVLMEAAAAGVPVISTDVPGCREAVLHGKTGLLVPPGDERALLAAIEQLAGSHELRGEFSREAIKHARQFDKKHVVENTIREYVALLGS